MVMYQAPMEQMGRRFMQRELPLHGVGRARKVEGPWDLVVEVSEVVTKDEVFRAETFKDSGAVDTGGRGLTPLEEEADQ